MSEELRSDIVPTDYSSAQVKMATLGVLSAFTPDIFQSDYFRSILSGVMQASVCTSFDLKFTFIRDSEKGTKSIEKMINCQSLDALLVLTWRLHLPNLNKATWGDRKIPVVALNEFEPSFPASIVYMEAASTARLAMRYLLSRGYQRIGMIQAPTEEAYDARERERVFREVLKEEKIDLDPAHFKKCDYFFEEDGYIKMMEMIHSANSLPRALFCFNDDLAIGAMRALREEKILIPQEVAVIGIDGLERGKYVNPPLTTISQPLEQIGREMVRMASSLVREPEKGPLQTRFEPQLVIRQSA